MLSDDSGPLAFTDDAKEKAWKSHYQQLLNEEFDCKDSLPEIDPAVQGPAIRMRRRWYQGYQ